MKNVTPAAGQVWEYKEYKVKLTKVTLNTIEHESEKNGGKYVDSMDDFLSSFKFAPQNDLEWLAVNVEKWFKSANQALDELSGTAFYWRGDSVVRCATIENDAVYHTREQWQNMRYELGLDERPMSIKEYIFDEIKKETKMIDLNHCKIDDKFVTARGRVMTVFAFGHNSVVMRDEEGQFNVFDIDSGCVITFKTGPQYDIVSKHDPRPWLKDLPDAGLFNCGWLACDRVEGWHGHFKDGYFKDGYFVSDGNGSILDCLFMPILTGDQWRDSKISIPDLKAWQEQNK